MSSTRTETVDAVIIGGGVAALWTANVLKNAGRSVVVLANSPLGEGQSLAAQGVIHGGLKYAVGGKLTDSSEALAGMPDRWLAALQGKGPVDLSGAHLLSDHQLMWSLPNLVSKTVGFFGSKALRGRSGAIAREDYPPVFQTSSYKGSLFRIEEPVVDPVSIIRELARGVAEETWLVDWGKDASFDPENGITIGDITLQADRYVLAAGAGNGPLLSQCEIETPAMQLRPLHQLIIRHADLPDFYSVCVGNGPKPPVVVTTHTDSAGRKVWYVGGDIAEQAGVDRGEAEQIEFGKETFAKLMPWIDLREAEWFTWRGSRAEPHTGTGDRPSGAYCEEIGKTVVTWPTKLALAPDLAEKVGALLSPRPRPRSPLALSLPHPPLGKAPWDLP